MVWAFLGPFLLQKKWYLSGISLPSHSNQTECSRPQKMGHLVFVNAVQAWLIPN